MNRKFLVFSAMVIIAFAAAVLFSKSGLGLKKKEMQKQETAAAEHQSHGEDKASQDSGESPAVEIDSDRQKMIGVSTVEAALHPMQKVIRTVGRIEYDERRLSTINAKFEGWIEKLYIDYSGRYVKKGEPVCEIYSPELVATQQEFLNALRWSRQNADAAKSKDDAGLKSMLVRDAQALVEAARRRLSLWDITDDQIRKIEETGKPVRTMTLYSPVNGYVVQKMALQGMRIMPGEKLFDLADLSSVWIIAEIYENELAMARQGQKAVISLSYFPERKIDAVIDYIYPALSAETRTARVRFIVPNSGQQFKPQMFTNVEIAIPAGRRLTVPVEAVLDTGTRQIVYIDKGEGLFEPHEIRTGMRMDGQLEVLEGLKTGQKIASSAIFLIDSEAQLKGVRPLASGHKH